MTAPAQPVYQRAAHLMVKPIGPRCNLRCKYCFYLEKFALFDKDEDYRMPDDVLERFIVDYLRWQTTPEVEFAWQGGEPTLLGVPFFERVVALQRKHGQGRVIKNAFQTNGTLLDDAWGAFLARNRFLVGLSIDGPEDIHDANRVHADGSGTHAEVMRGMEILKRHGVAFNALTCISNASNGMGRRVYRFLKDQGVRFMQFIPIVERMPDADAQERGLALAAPPDVEQGPNTRSVMPFTVTPDAFGGFLVDVFDEWIKKDVGRVFVNHFDIALAAWCGMNPPLCVYSKVCGTALALEHDGSIYACDHFVYPEFYRGNLMTDGIQAAVMNMDQQAFGARKWTALPSCCTSCDVLHACHGGCLKHRFEVSPEGEPGLNYLCAGYKRFFTHVGPVMQRMAEHLRAGRPASDIMTSGPRLAKPGSGKRGTKRKPRPRRRR